MSCGAGLTLADWAVFTGAPICHFIYRSMVAGVRRVPGFVFSAYEHLGLPLFLLMVHSVLAVARSGVDWASLLLDAHQLHTCVSQLTWHALCPPDDSEGLVSTLQVRMQCALRGGGD